MSPEIRTAQLADLPYLYEICLKTGANGADASHLVSDPFAIGQFFAAPYLVHNANGCFVATLNNLPKGYVIGTLDTVQFNEWLNTAWLPQLRAIYPRPSPLMTATDQFVYTCIHNDSENADYMNDYPSHLHIDLLPDLQGYGLGKTMIDTLLDYLAANGSRGVHLGVGTQNERAVNFYQKYGFKPLVETDSSLVLGLTL